MYEPVKYKRLKEIISELKSQIETIDSGKLSREEIENAAELGRELYERLVVIRHKAYDHLVKGDDISSAEPAPIPFKVPEIKHEVSPNQISLIDAIQELAPETIEEKIPAVAKSEVIVPEVKTPEVKMPEVKIPESKPAHTPHIAKPVQTTSAESIHERLSRDIPKKESLSEKIEHAPIPDLKKAISINQRFQFSKELFKNNSQEYEVAIEKLNSTSRDEAMRMLDNLKSKFSWSDESAVVNDFRELVDRRHS
jgi:hypothetical protein